MEESAPGLRYRIYGMMIMMGTFGLTHVKNQLRLAFAIFFTFLLLGSKYSKDERRTSTSREAMRGTSYARATVTRSIHNLLYDKSPYVSLIPD